MKKFSKINEAKRSAKLDIQPNTMNYISVEQLDKYLAVAGKFISQEAREVVNWLKVNNENYLHELDPDMDADNALAAFYDNGVPKNEKLKELYKLIGVLAKRGSLLEVPVFQTEEQFTAIIDKKVSPDEILIGDISSTTDGLPITKDSNNDYTPTARANRDKLFKKYQPLIYKIVNQFNGKSSLPYEELYAVGCLGFVNAMNSFGHAKKRDENGKWVEVDKSEQHINYTFGQYAGYQVRNQILGAIEDSHLVRIAKSEQKKQREEKGYNAKSNSVSGDMTVGHDNEGNGKTLFDYIEDTENGGKNIDNEDLVKLWKSAYARLEEKFGKEDMEFFYRAFRINGHEDEKLKQKELAAEYGLKPSTANIRLHKILKFIKDDKQLLDMFTQILELTHESQQNAYTEEEMLTEGAKLDKTIRFGETE